MGTEAFEGIGHSDLRNVLKRIEDFDINEEDIATSHNIIDILRRELVQSTNSDISSLDLEIPFESGLETHRFSLSATSMGSIGHERLAIVHDNTSQIVISSYTDVNLNEPTIPGLIPNTYQKTLRMVIRNLTGLEVTAIMIDSDGNNFDFSTLNDPTHFKSILILLKNNVDSIRDMLKKRNRI